MKTPRLSLAAIVVCSVALLCAGTLREVKSEEQPMAFTATQLPIEGTLPSLGGAIEWLNTQPLNMKPRCTGKSYSSSFGLIPASTGGAPFLTSAHGRTNTRIEIGPDLGPIIAGKNAAQSSPSLSHPSTPPGSCCPVRYAVGDGCNPSATLRSCSWHLRSTRTDSRSGIHRAACR